MGCWRDVFGIGRDGFSGVILVLDQDSLGLRSIELFGGAWLIMLGYWVGAFGGWEDCFGFDRTDFVFGRTDFGIRCGGFWDLIFSDTLFTSAYFPVFSVSFMLATPLIC